MLLHLILHPTEKRYKSALKLSWLRNALVESVSQRYRENSQKSSVEPIRKPKFWQARRCSVAPARIWVFDFRIDIKDREQFNL